MYFYARWSGNWVNLRFKKWMIVMRNKHIGSNFDDFLRDEDLLDVASATAVKRVLAYQVQQLIKETNG